MEVRFVDLDGSQDDEAVVVVDVLRAFTTVPWLRHRGVERVLAVDTPERAFTLRDRHLPGVLLAGEEGGAQLPGFDLGNSPVDVEAWPDGRLQGATVVQRTSAGTQGLARCAGSAALFAASFVTASATAKALVELAPARVTFVVTGASYGRNGDEDLAAAELIAALARGDDVDPTRYVDRVATSDAGQSFVEGGPSWASPADLAAACEVDRFDRPVVARPVTIGSGPTAIPTVELR